MAKDTILVIGASGQIGSELVMELRSIYGSSYVIASDIKLAPEDVVESGPFEYLDILDESRLNEVLKKYSITHVYLMVALLSATSEKKIEQGWELNMRS